MRDRSAAAFALAGARIFDGDRFLDEHAVAVDGGYVTAVIPERELPTTASVRRIAGLLAPGFIDVQVNGGGGVLFNAAPSVEGIASLARAHRRLGTTGLLPTFISDTREHTAEAVSAVREAIARGIPGVLGIHLEGPFLNQDRAGAHDPRFIRPWDDGDLPLLTSLEQGVTLVTVAPEVVPTGAIGALSAAGVVIAAGHTEAPVAMIGAARAAGLRGFTHLFNAMPPLAARDPGPVGAALVDGDAWVSLIVDLEHVSVVALQAVLAARGPERTILVTDAMPVVGTDHDEFIMQGRRIRREGARLLTETGRLAGSCLDMATAVRNAVHAVGVPLQDALRMASSGPASFLGLDADHGRIAPGYRASFVLLDSHLRVTGTWINGA